MLLVLLLSAGAVYLYVTEKFRADLVAIMVLGVLILIGLARNGNSITVKANTDAKLLVMHGELIAEPVVGHGPFVMNSRAEIEQAYEDYELGHMGEIAWRDYSSMRRYFVDGWNVTPSMRGSGNCTG